MTAPDQVLPTVLLETSRREPQGSTRPPLPSSVLLPQPQPGPAHPRRNQHRHRWWPRCELVYTRHMWSGVWSKEPPSRAGEPAHLEGHLQPSLAIPSLVLSFLSLHPTPTFSCFWLGRDLGLRDPWEPSDSQTQSQPALRGGWEHQQLLIRRRQKSNR